jgi:orotidine-5'-phosphate decarboxylase
MSVMKNPIFLSLDINSWDEAHRISKLLKNEVGGFKVGPRLAIQATVKDWQKLSDCGPIFYDPKFYDIPNTMVESIKACLDLGVSYITIHASSGLKAMSEIKKIEDQINKSHFFKVLAVTALTSFDDTNPIPGYKNQKLNSVVQELAELTLNSGLSGLVCSGEEVEIISKMDPNVFTVVPGIRLKEGSLDDQKRVMTPDLALAKGAKALVVGRPIIEASDPLMAAKKFSSLCKS